MRLMTEKSETQDLQASLLNRFRQEGTIVAIWLVSGKRLVGRIRGFDRFTVIIDHAGADQLVFKHAIATIGPFKEKT